MKKNLQTGLILVMVFLSANSFAQSVETNAAKPNEEKPKLHSQLGVLLNVVSTNLNYGDLNTALTDSKKSILGLQVGASYQAVITSRFSVVSELYFMMKGGRLKENNPKTIEKSTLRLYTIESPLLARFHFGKIYINAGPSIAYNLFGSSKLGDDSKALSFTNAAGGFKRWDMGIQAGAGYLFTTKRKAVVLDLRYTYGLSNIAYGQEIYNRNVNISLHFSRLHNAKPLDR